jgi:hypothetical protein
MSQGNLTMKSHSQDFTVFEMYSQYIKFIEFWACIAGH